MAASDVDLRKPLKVVFSGEEGIDEGGVRKEFFQLLMAQLLSLEYGMFVPTTDARALWINSNNVWSAEEFRLVGTLLGLAVYNNVLLDVHFPKVGRHVATLSSQPFVDTLDALPLLRLPIPPRRCTRSCSEKRRRSSSRTFTPWTRCCTKA